MNQNGINKAQRARGIGDTQKMSAETSVLWQCGKLLNFNYKLFGGEIQEMGRYQTSGQRQTGTGATFLV